MQCWMHQGTTMRYNDIKADIECCKKYGFSAIEIKYNIVRNYNATWLKELLNKNGIRAGSIGAIWIPILQETQIKKQREIQLRNLCQYAQVIGAEYIMILPTGSDFVVDWNQIKKDAVKILKDYTKIAAEHNIKLAMEIMGFSNTYINTIEKGLEIIDQVGEKSLGIVYDFYHVLGMEDLGKSILKAAGENIFIVHVNDGKKCVAGEYFDDHRLWPGDGDIDLKRQMDMLLTIGYKGPYSVEVYQPQAWSFGIQECYKTARNKIDKIAQLVSMQ